jgi:hypothetical protein
MLVWVVLTLALSALIDNALHLADIGGRLEIGCGREG